jgi:hypothetical protein
MPSNSIKCKDNLHDLGKIIPVALKYLIYAMPNSPCATPQAHGSDLAPVKYPTGVTDVIAPISISPDMSSCNYKFTTRSMGQITRILLGKVRLPDVS